MINGLVGTRLSKYEVQAEIGRGGMGSVYRGYDPALDRHVAIKVLAPHLVWEEGFVERFLREARAAARLKHPNIVTVYDVGQEGGWYYFVMEYLEGQTLTQLIQQKGRLAPDEILSILRPLAEALDYAHHRGLVHRDIKPGNVVVDSTGRPTLMDFGIARAAQETRLTSTGTLVGTPEYMSPEQVRGMAIDARSDQYSLGVVVYEMLSGQVPFQAESTLALLYKVVHEPLPSIRQSRPDLPEKVKEVLSRVLAKEPGDRYATVSDFVNALGWALTEETAGEGSSKASVVSDQPQIARREPVGTSLVGEKSRSNTRRVPGWVWPIGGLAVLALAVGMVMGLRNAESKPTPPSLPTEEETPVAENTVAAPTLSSPEPQPTPRVVFVSKRDGNSEIYTMGIDGSDQVNLTRHPASDSQPAWSPDGTHIAFVSYRDDNLEIYVMDADGSNLVRLTEDPGSDVAPAWSPDGARIAFSSNRSGRYEIYVMDADGTAIRQVSRNGGRDFSWSPSGDRIAYVSYEPEQLCTVSPDGSGLVRLTDSVSGLGRPVWSPDGEHLAFCSNYEDLLSVATYVVDSRGGESKRLADVDGRSPAWSTDGKQVAIVGYSGTLRWSVYVVDVVGGGLAQVYHSWDHSWANDLMWLTAGGTIGFVTEDGIYTLNVEDGTAPINLTNGPGYDGDPDWWLP